MTVLEFQIQLLETCLFYFCPNLHCCIKMFQPDLKCIISFTRFWMPILLIDCNFYYFFSCIPILFRLKRKLIPFLHLWEILLLLILFRTDTLSVLVLTLLQFGLVTNDLLMIIFRVFGNIWKPGLRIWAAPKSFCMKNILN